MSNSLAAVFVLVSFEGPDLYSRAGGLATRVTELASCLASSEFETHLFFVGDPSLPGYEVVHDGKLHIHRWCQWISAYHPSGVYDGEEGKHYDLSRSLPPWLIEHLIVPSSEAGQTVVIIGEEWHAAEAVIRVGEGVQQARLDGPVLLLWNANNTFGFERINWEALRRYAVITTVSKYMKHLLRTYGVEAIVVPNGISESWPQPVDQRLVKEVGRIFNDRVLLVKVARWDHAKNWGSTITAIAKLKQMGLRPTLIARGGTESYGAEVMALSRRFGLSVADATPTLGDASALLQTLHLVRDHEIINVRAFLSEEQQRVLFRAATAVLANSRMEPFGLVGLEAMAAGGIVFTGHTGEDYAVHNDNAIVLETDSADELVSAVVHVARDSLLRRRLRKGARATATRYTWPAVLRRVFLPRVEEMLAQRRITRR